ncbi:MAG: F0F1 ATP synthase subunit A [Clostridia bacterium]|nr:F0F1 ATP synthase subunit A [Clostridia bacterium]
MADTKLNMELPSLQPKTIYFEGSPFKITDTMVSAAITTVVLIIFAIIVRVAFIPRWKKTYDKKSGFRLLLEALVNMFEDNAVSTVGHNSKFIAPWYFAAAAFVCIGTLLEMTGLRPPTSDLNVTLSLGVTTFVLINYYGFKEKKWRRFLRFANPINDLTDIVIPFSMALRMFGSVFSGYLIMHLIYSLPWFAKIALPALASVIFTIFHALIQSYIFMFLSMSFISEATE